MILKVLHHQWPVRLPFYIQGFTKCVIKRFLHTSMQRPDVIKPAGGTTNKGKTYSYQQNLYGKSYALSSIRTKQDLQEVKQKLWKNYGPSFPKSQNTLPNRRIEDSYTVLICSGGGTQFQSHGYCEKSQYGLLLGLIDVIKPHIVERHLDIPSFDKKANVYICVGVFMDHVSFTDASYSPDKPLRIAAHVVATGRSSLEVDFNAEQQDDKGKWTTVATASGISAARKPDGSSAVVNPLIHSNENEREFIKTVQERAARRELLKADMTGKVPPLPHELRPFTDAIEAIKLRPNKVLIKDTEIKKKVRIETKHRNRWFTGFGGFLLSFAEWTASEAVRNFSKANPALHHMGHVTFVNPVPIGSEFVCTARIGAVVVEKQSLAYVPVIGEADINGSKQVTTVFHFAYKLDQDSNVVVPESPSERLLFLNGWRFLRFIQDPKSMYPEP